MTLGTTGLEGSGTNETRDWPDIRCSNAEAISLQPGQYTPSWVKTFWINCSLAKARLTRMLEVGYWLCRTSSITAH